MLLVKKGIQQLSFPLLLLLPLFFYSCGEEPTLKPGFTGASGELLVVAEDNHWNNLKEDVLDLLQPNFPMLPQQEAMFTVLHYAPDKINQLLERHRNILIIDISKDHEIEPQLSLIKDYKSKNQYCYKIEARELEQARTLLLQSAETILIGLRNVERTRYQRWLNLHAEEKLEEKVKDLFGYNVILPKGTKAITLDSNFVRLQWEREKNLGGVMHYITFGIVLYKYPYTSDSTFTNNTLVENRNRYLKRIPGPKKGAYMSTQTFIPAESSILDPFPGFAYSADFRGLWRTKNSFLGGLFVSTTHLEPKGEEVVASEVFVLAPKFDKREFAKEAEAIAYSIRPK